MFASPGLVGAKAIDAHVLYPGKEQLDARGSLLKTQPGSGGNPLCPFCGGAHAPQRVLPRPVVSSLGPSSAGQGCHDGGSGATCARRHARALRRSERGSARALASRALPRRDNILFVHPWQPPCAEVREARVQRPDPVARTGQPCAREAGLVISAQVFNNETEIKILYFHYSLFS